MRRFGVAGVIILVTLGAAQTAMAASWNQQSIPAPQAANGVFQGVSCSSSTACTAVGVFNDSVGIQRTQAQRWNGTSWTAQSTPIKNGATQTFLQAVSCGGPSSCTAVGVWNGSAGDGPFITHWAGSTWSGQSAPAPPQSSSVSLFSVSCSSATLCTAVGYYYNTSSSHYLPLAMRWNGTSWALQAVPTAAGATYSRLDSVSCASSTSCVAAGTTEDSTASQALVETWNGTSWHVQTLTLPAGATYSELVGVSCSATTACSAVGDYDQGSTNHLFAERLSGTTWALEAMPSPSTGRALLSGVSCGAANACQTVGMTTDFDTLTSSVLVERWTGTSWVLQSAPTPSAPGGGFLDGISCTAASACIGVGGRGFGGALVSRRHASRNAAPRSSPVVPVARASGTQLGYFSGSGVVLAETWGGSAWSVQSTLNHVGAVSSTLPAVQCPGASYCIAVGSEYASGFGPPTPLAARWNGSAWALEPVPLPSGVIGMSLLGVSCVTTSACTAVGQGTTTGGQEVVALEHWNGSSWAVQSAPSIPNSGDAFLSAVSCFSASACTAVGTYDNTTVSHDVPLVERWNGTSWSLQSAPNPGSAKRSDLDGVSCKAVNACMAVGSYDTSGGTTTRLIEGWNGTTWTVRTMPPLPSGVTYSNLDAISCSAATACTAIGSTSDAPPLILRWNGTSWTSQNLAVSSENYRSISCWSNTACTAVGGYNTAFWNGSTWSTQTIFQLPDGGSPQLYGVSCTSAAACTATGEESLETQLPLVERYS
jgi:hypothetical protein